MTKMHQLDFDKPVTDRYALFDEWRGRYELEHSGGLKLGTDAVPATPGRPLVGSMYSDPVQFFPVLGAPDPTWIYCGEVDEVLILREGRYYSFTDGDLVGWFDSIEDAVEDIYESYEG